MSPPPPLSFGRGLPFSKSEIEACSYCHIGRGYKIEAMKREGGHVYLEVGDWMVQILNLYLARSLISSLRCKA